MKNIKERIFVGVAIAVILGLLRFYGEKVVDYFSLVL